MLSPFPLVLDNGYGSKKIGSLHLPLLPFAREVLAQHTAGTYTLSNHLCEGVVVGLIEEREDLEVGRVLLKSISANYLVRKGSTELN